MISSVSAPVSACSLTHGLVVVHGPPELQWYLMPPSLADKLYNLTSGADWRMAYSGVLLL